MEGWVDLGDLIAPRPGVEPAAVTSVSLEGTRTPTTLASMSSHHLLLQPFASGWRHSCFNSHFRTSSFDITKKHSPFCYLGTRNGYCYFSHVKNLWLIDWLRVCLSRCVVFGLIISSRSSSSKFLSVNSRQWWRTRKPTKFPPWEMPVPSPNWTSMLVYVWS